MNVNNADNTIASLQKQISCLQGQLPPVSFVYFRQLIGDINGLVALFWDHWLSDRKGIWRVKNLCHLSSKILFQNSWKKNLEGTGKTMFSSKTAIKVELVLIVDS